MYQYFQSILQNNNCLDRYINVDNKQQMENDKNYVIQQPFEIISVKKKIIITGSEGQIGYYVKQEFIDYEIFALIKDDIQLEDNIIKIKCDLFDTKLLEKIIVMINPYAIVHLAGISCTQICKSNPIDAIQTNGLLCVNICDIIYRNRLSTKLFNSSSSEVYKGHKIYEIKSNDNSYKPTHPYSISKCLSHSMVKWYRETYNLNFSNGIIFTTESVRRKPSFVTKKCLNHISSIGKGEHYVLKLGSLEAYRCFIHAKDVAKAIKIIINEEQGDDYNICGDFIVNMKSYVIELYKNYNIDLIEKNSVLYSDNIALVEFDNIDLINHRADYSIDRNSVIVGDNSKLKQMGWIVPSNLSDFIKQIKELI